MAIQGKRDPKMAVCDSPNLTKDQLDYYGVGGDTPNPQKLPVRKAPKFGEKTIKGPYGSYITLGVDRLNTVKDIPLGGGHGPLGHFACAHIDLVAGLSSVDQNKGKVTDVPLNPDAFRDAARVYISQMCDVDNQFQCAQGGSGNVTERSAVVAKADSIRIISRDGGVKIISGGDTHNSKGEPLRSVPTIDLIGGNYGGADTEVLKSAQLALQPVVRGSHLVLCLQEVLKDIKFLQSMYYKFFNAQMNFNVAVEFHTHPDHVAQAIGACANGNPKAFVMGETGYSKDTMTAGVVLNTVASELMAMNTAMGALLEGTNDAFLENPIRPAHINSRNVKTN